MSNVYDVNEKLHKMRAKLYPNYLPGGEGTFIARTTNEASVNVEDICAAMKNRGGFDGSYDEAVKSVRHFFKEMEYQLADGFSVNTGLFTIHPNIGGVFHSDKEIHDHAKHPITFRYQSLKSLLSLRDDIQVILEGYADSQGHIAEFVDTEEELTNTMFKPGNMFVIHGYRIKVAGSDPACGVYFVPTDGTTPPAKVTRLSENTPSRITGIIPDSGYAYNRIEIRTQYSTGASLLKAPRIITSSFILEHI